MFWEIAGWEVFWDGSLLIQAHGPGAVQFVGLCLPEEKTATMGDGKLSTEAATSLNETGTCSCPSLFLNAAHWVCLASMKDSVNWDPPPQQTQPIVTAPRALDG